MLIKMCAGIAILAFTNFAAASGNSCHSILSSETLNIKSPLLSNRQIDEVFQSIEFKSAFTKAAQEAFTQARADLEIQRQIQKDIDLKTQELEDQVIRISNLMSKTEIEEIRYSFALALRDSFIPAIYRKAKQEQGYSYIRDEEKLESHFRERMREQWGPIYKMFFPQLIAEHSAETTLRSRLRRFEALDYFALRTMGKGLQFATYTEVNRFVEQQLEITKLHPEILDFLKSLGLSVADLNGSNNLGGMSFSREVSYSGSERQIVGKPALIFMRLLVHTFEILPDNIRLEKINEINRAGVYKNENGRITVDPKKIALVNSLLSDYRMQLSDAIKLEQSMDEKIGKQLQTSIEAAWQQLNPGQ